MGALILQPGQDETPLVLETTALWWSQGRCVYLNTSYTKINKAPFFPRRRHAKGSITLTPQAGHSVLTGCPCATWEGW